MTISNKKTTALHQVDESPDEPEDMFRQVFTNSSDAIMVFDAQTLRFEDANTASLNLFGYAKSEFIDLTFSDISQDKDHKAVLEKIAFQSDNGTLFNFRRKDGSVFTGETAVGVCISGNRKKFIGGVRDITHRMDTENALKKVEDALKISQGMLHQAQKMEALGTLVSGVAHEINNPVNLLMYSMPILKRVWNDFLPLFGKMAADDPGKTFGGLTYNYLKENLSQILSDADLASDRITKIVADLKNFAKQTNIEDTAPTQINLAVKNALRLAQTTIRKSGVALAVDLGSDIPLMDGNLQSIEQIVLNLTINAIQAVDRDHGKIRIATTHDRNTGKTLLTVSDNGRGITPEIAEKLFDPFVTDKQIEGGTGLGLSVTYSLVRAHQGEITFRTEVNRGTTFSASFPSKLKPKEARILVVDDENPVRDVLVNALNRKAAYTVEEAADGIKACIKLGSFKPDLLILDLFMPGMNGLEVCRVIKSDKELADLKVIITTGYPGHELLDEMAKLGFDKVLFKPIAIVEFLEFVEGVLRQ